MENYTQRIKVYGPYLNIEYLSENSEIDLYNQNFEINNVNINSESNNSQHH